MREALEVGAGMRGGVMLEGDAVLPMLIHSLEGSAREIDLTFATAGRQLGEGLSLFETLKERLSTLSSELAGSEIAQAGATLAGLAGELRAINDGLQGETATLRELARHGNAASQALDRLLDHMRLITILARSARIEAVSIQAAGRDFGDFTSEIMTLTTQAQRTIQACARDYERLSGLLGSALAAQRDFDGRYGHALSDLATNLEQTLAEVAERQQRSVALTHDAATHSGRIAAAAGGAIIALQSGDSIRQRLEHALAALRLVGTLREGAGAGAGLSEAARQAGILALRRLQSAQLRESAATLGGDAEAIEAALALLAGDTLGLLDLVRSLYQGDGASSASFLTDLEADLAQASDLLGKCDRARSGVDRVTEVLAAVLDTCQQTVASLADTVTSIVLIGMNAGLRAARVGTDGRSLVVIAQELKLAADQIAGDADRLAPTFAQMQVAAAGLKGDGRLDAAHFAALDQAMRGSLSAMRQTGDRLGATLDQLTREGSGFCTVLAEARLSFSNTGAMSDLIGSAADELARSAAGEELDQAAVASLRDLFQQHVWPSYTMAAERTIHKAVMAECGIPDQEAATAVAAAPADALDEFIF
jgi:hypothetical protein